MLGKSLVAADVVSVIDVFIVGSSRSAGGLLMESGRVLVLVDDVLGVEKACVVVVVLVVATAAKTQQAADISFGVERRENDTIILY